MTDGSASQSLIAFFRRLHPMTRFIVAVAVLHMAAEIVIVWGDIASAWPSLDPEMRRAKLLLFAQAIRSLSYPVLDLGTAATVEFLFRIWEELKVRKATVTARSD
jgi:hypothetical protein